MAGQEARTKDAHARVRTSHTEEEERKMSLNVSPELMEKAKAGAVTDKEFVDCVKESLSLAWNVVHQLAHDVTDLAKAPLGYVIYDGPKEAAEERAELLRMLASTSMREAVERDLSAHIGKPVRIGFVNCHRAVIHTDEGEPGSTPRPEQDEGQLDKNPGEHRPRRPTFEELTGPAAQLLNQRKEMQHC